ncbi:hypothetical protein ACH0CP_18630 [Sphingomonas sp. 179-I 2A4 NHS]
MAVLAAGNHATLKPFERIPRTGNAIAAMPGETFAADRRSGARA